jgi:hypothetical protein
MPKTEIDYSKTVIYKIVCNDLNITDLYVGSTTDFTKRKCQHKTVCNNPNAINHNIKVYKTIREKGGWDNWTMIEIEKFGCKDKNEALARERYWFETLEAKLNVKYPKRDSKEWFKDNYETILEKNKQYRDIHKEEVKEYHKNYREIHCDKIKASRSQYYEKQQQYRINKSDDLNKKVVCECGTTYTHHHKSDHCKSKKHQNFMNSN